MTQGAMTGLPGPKPALCAEPQTPPGNALLYASPSYFDAEMQALAASSWQFFCTTDDLLRANDWVRRKVFGVDIFVQNFVGELRGYHNVCQHRGFPLRREPRGNSTVQCFFHGWAYNPKGVPVGIPRNKQLFGLSREQQVDLALPAVRVATVGRFVFVALQPSVPPIETFLGRYSALLEAVSRRMGGLQHRWNGPTKANWKLSYEVTLDDYHVAFVHPNTLGATPVPMANLFYDREAHHSHLFTRRDEDWKFTNFWDDVVKGNFDFTGYKIHHLFPNLLLVVSYKIVLITLFSPQGPALTEVDDLIFDLKDDEAEEGWWEKLCSDHRKVSAEDREVSESQQETIAQFARRPLFGAMEERVRWFHESYEALVGSEARRTLPQ